MAWDCWFGDATEVEASADQVCCDGGHSARRWPFSHSLSEDKGQFAASALLKTSEPIGTAEQDSCQARQQEQLLVQPKLWQNKRSRLMQRRVDSISLEKLLPLNSLIKSV